jgi:small nuclear ribonucleoprotein (snRNP)-like protein
MSPFSAFTFATNPHWIRSGTSPSRRRDKDKASTESSTLALLPINFFLFLVTAARTHGRPHPFHHLRLARRPRGQYVHLRPANPANPAARRPADIARVEKVLVILRDGRKLLGLFRSYDQFGELLVPCACNRSHPQRACKIRENSRPVDLPITCRVYIACAAPRLTTPQPTSSSSRPSSGYITSSNMRTEI